MKRVREGSASASSSSRHVPRPLETGRVGAKLSSSSTRRSAPAGRPAVSRSATRLRLSSRRPQLSQAARPRRCRRHDGPAEADATPIALDNVYACSTAIRARRRPTTAGLRHGVRGPCATITRSFDLSPRLILVLAPVAHNLADQRTRLAGFFQPRAHTRMRFRPRSPRSTAGSVQGAGCTRSRRSTPIPTREGDVSKARPRSTLDALAEGPYPFLRDSAKLGPRPQQRGLRAQADVCRRCPARSEVCHAVQSARCAPQRPPVAMRPCRRRSSRRPTPRCSPQRQPSAPAATARFLGPYVPFCNYGNLLLDSDRRSTSRRRSAPARPIAALLTRPVTQANLDGNRRPCCRRRSCSCAATPLHPPTRSAQPRPTARDYTVLARPTSIWATWLHEWRQLPVTDLKT